MRGAIGLVGDSIVEAEADLLLLHLDFVDLLDLQIYESLDSYVGRWICMCAA